MTHISTLNDLEVQTVEAKPTQDIPKKQDIPDTWILKTDFTENIFLEPRPLSPVLAWNLP
jgi:hypothetical protein